MTAAFVCHRRDSRLDSLNAQLLGVCFTCLLCRGAQLFLSLVILSSRAFITGTPAVKFRTRLVRFRPLHCRLWLESDGKGAVIVTKKYDVNCDEKIRLSLLVIVTKKCYDRKHAIHENCQDDPTVGI